MTSRSNTSVSSLLKWRVGLFSTDYDLNPVRIRVAEFIKDVGFECVHFEGKSFPGRGLPRVHSHEACVVSTEHADLGVSIMAARYGGLYLGRGPASVTEEELGRLLDDGKPVLWFVHKKTWNLRDDRRRELRQIATRNLSEKEAVRKFGCAGRVKFPWLANPVKVDWMLLRQLDRIQDRKNEKWITQFNDVDHLLKELEGILKARTHSVADILARAQRGYFDSARFTTGGFGSLSELKAAKCLMRVPFDVNGPRRPTGGALGQVRAITGNGAVRSVLIYGPPGSGKTLLLVEAFGDHVDRLDQEQSLRRPFFVSLRGLGSQYHFDFEKYFDESCEVFLGKQPYPLKDLSSVQPVFYIDGLDEAAVLPDEADAKKLIATDMLQRRFALTARNVVVEGRVDISPKLGSAVNRHLLLKPWDSALARRFASKYLRYRGLKIRKLAVALKWLDEGGLAWAHEYPENISPLLLSFALYIYANEPETDLKEFQDGGLLVERFLHVWAARETNRTEGPGPSFTNKPDLLLQAWALTAWQVYIGRHKEEQTSLTRISDCLEEASPGLSKITNSAAYRSAIVITPFGNFVTGMMNETILQYLVALHFTKSLNTPQMEAADYLKFQVHYRVNSFIKSLWSRVHDNEKRDALASLCAAFKSAKGSSNGAVNMRVNSIYYISRVPLLPEAANTLKTLVPHAPDLYTKNAILWALSRLGDREAEVALYNSLTNDPTADAINRGLHLVYFQDWNPTLELMPPYSDNGTRDWSRTLDGLMSHLRSNLSRFLRTKRLDLYTIRSLVKQRGKRGPLTKKRLQLISASIRRTSGEVQDHQYQKMLTELEALVHTWEVASN